MSSFERRTNPMAREIVVTVDLSLNALPSMWRAALEDAYARQLAEIERVQRGGRRCAADLFILNDYLSAPAVLLERRARQSRMHQQYRGRRR